VKNTVCILRYSNLSKKRKKIRSQSNRIMRESSVADPDPFDTKPDPDTAGHFDKDPAFRFDTDPDPYHFKRLCT
jgi:hypothetical protein